MELQRGTDHRASCEEDTDRLFRHVQRWVNSVLILEGNVQEDVPGNGRRRKPCLVGAKCRSVFDKTPALLLDATLRGIENEQLASLLELRVSKDEILAHVVVVDVLGRWFVGMDPLSRGASRERESGNGQRQHRQSAHEILQYGVHWSEHHKLCPNPASSNVEGFEHAYHARKFR